MPESNPHNSGFSIEIIRNAMPGYRVVREVGHGAMGIVFEAVQKGVERRVAVKVLPPALALRERTVKRFLREAEAMGKLEHSSIVDVFEVGTLEDLHFFSMKYVDGPPLDRVLKAGPLATSDVVGLGIGVAEALAHAHARGVLHRDVKPANLLRSGDSVMLTDFGLARPIDTEDAGTMTESGDLVGTPLYMAPEQIGGDADKIDGRADIWGLGVTLYELLAGKPPFSGANAQSILHAILHKDPPRLSKVRDDVSRDLEAVVFKCLEKDPGRRYTTAGALRDDLVAVREGRAVSAAAPRFFDPAVRWVRRHPIEAGVLGTFVVVAFLLGSYLLSTQGELQDTKSDLTEAESARAEAVVARDDQIDQKLVIWARLEMSEVRELARTANTSAERREAQERLIDVLEQLPVAAYPETAAEAIEMLAGWLHQSDLDEQALQLIDQIAGDEDSQLVLFLRAAALAGQGRMNEALALHRERARLAPEDPRPPLDAARMLRRMAIADLDAGERRRSRGRLFNALLLLEQGVQRAVAGADEDLVLEAAVERARCLMELDDPERAMRELEMVLEQDPTAFVAFSLHKACQRMLRRRAEVAQANQAAKAPEVPATSATLPSELVATSPTQPAPAPEGTSLLSTDQLPDISLETLVPGRETLTEELQSAGQNLQTIFRGLQSLLGEEEAVDGDEPQTPAPAPAEGPGPQAGTPGT